MIAVRGRLVVYCLQACSVAASVCCCAARACLSFGCNAPTLQNFSGLPNTDLLQGATQDCVYLSQEESTVNE